MSDDSPVQELHAAAPFTVPAFATPANIDVLNAALQVFGTLGLSKATISDIVEESGRSQSQIYKEFRSGGQRGLSGVVHALFVQCWDHVWTALLRQVCESGLYLSDPASAYTRYYMDFLAVGTAPDMVDKTTFALAVARRRSVFGYDTYAEFPADCEPFRRFLELGVRIAEVSREHHEEWAAWNPQSMASHIPNTAINLLYSADLGLDLVAEGKKLEEELRSGSPDDGGPGYFDDQMAPQPGSGRAVSPLLSEL